MEAIKIISMIFGAVILTFVGLFFYTLKKIIDIEHEWYKEHGDLIHPPVDK